MREFLLTAIILSIFAMLFEGIIVFRNLKNKLHAYLFLNCITMLVNNTGYLLELLSKTEDGHPVASEDDHGIGTRSVLDFAKKTGSEIRYIAGNDMFKVRMLIG
ncbi:hypothetical protein WAA20_16340 [Butyrivibrio fibrisolvens]|nr:hypothetical protein [Butyrivibrio fibrisolvens]